MALHPPSFFETPKPNDEGEYKPGARKGARQNPSWARGEGDSVTGGTMPMEDVQQELVSLKMENMELKLVESAGH